MRRNVTKIGESVRKKNGIVSIPTSSQLTTIPAIALAIAHVTAALVIATVAHLTAVVVAVETK